MNVKHAHLSALMLAVCLAACGGGGGGGDAAATNSPAPAEASSPAPAPISAPTVFAALQADANYSIFLESLAKAGLTEKLKAPGTYTVFAPTNAAFEAMFKETSDTKQGFLDYPPYTTEVMNNLIMTSTHNIEDFKSKLGKLQTTAGGNAFKVFEKDGKLSVYDERNRVSPITSTDLNTGNGMIHTVGNVPLHGRQDLMAAMGSQPTYSTFLEAVKVAGMESTLKGTEAFTICVPSNDAFNKLFAELGTTKQALFSDVPLLSKILKYHMVPGKVLRADMPMNTPVPSVQGETFSINTAPSGTIITDQRGRLNYLIATDLFAKNGILHTLQEVMLPKP